MAAMPRLVVIGLLGLLASLAPVPGLAQAGGGRGVIEPAAILRIAATSTPSINGEPTLEVSLERVEGGDGRRLTYWVPNLPNANGVFDPLPDVSDTVRKLGVGGIVRARLGTSEHGLVLVGLIPVPHRPGEETTHGCVLVKTSKLRQGDAERTVLHVSRFGRASEFVLPLPAKDAAADDRMDAVLAELRPGDVIEVDVEPQTVVEGRRVLRLLAAYRPQSVGSFVGLDKDADGALKAKIEVDKQVVELPVVTTGRQGRLLDAALLRSLVKGRTVRFTTHAGEGGGLRSIRLDGTLAKGERGRGYVVTCGVTSFEISQFGRDRWDVRLQSRGSSRRPGSALLGGGELQYQMLLDDEQLAKLAAIPRPGTRVDEPAMGPAAQAAIAATEPAQRFAAEQKLYDLIQDFAARADEADARANDAVKAVLTPEQFDVLTRAMQGHVGGIIIR